ncbi:MAG: TIGR03435 family protein [Candidatus Sulfopaludibacter sp.]|nr:TIGR03435 family protein [Candidatus Sulfopaludibacter sp.]
MGRFLALAAFGSIALAWGQAPAQPAFEAASIKRSNPARTGSGLTLSPNRMRIVNAPLMFCVAMAWNVKDFQVSGATGWMTAEPYDIDAVAAAAFQKNQFRSMLQTLLAQRFGLAIHREMQDKPGYFLVTARNGAKLPPPVDDPNILMNRTPSGDRTLKATSATMSALAGVLSTIVGSTVVDRTGIEGQYDVSLQWTPEPGTEPLLSKSGLPLPPPPADAVPGPSIFNALQEKLGLKLEAHKVPADVIVIDRANRPSEN